MATAEATINRSDARVAFEAIDGIIQIAKREQLKQGFYVSEEVTNEALKNEGAICGGREACLIGSLYISYGVKGRWYPDDTWGGKDYALPGVQPRSRERYMRDKPDLKLAYETLNATAFRYIKKNYPYDYEEGEDAPTEGWAEFMFETLLPNVGAAYTERERVEAYNITRDEVIKVCRSAKRSLKRQYDL